ncbi:MAG: pyrroline-5-carboxylate reductase [Candidatus Kerfeldbacteria bacterium]|nr:pyrroline-5-carboxylate reductase [Candidatus Kerfeldbacteria bacterium]
MKKNNIVVIGGGNMGQAFIQCLLRLPRVLPRDITVVERNSTKRQTLAARFLIKSTPALSPRLLNQATVVLVAVKPQDFPGVAALMRGQLLQTGLLISIMAGVRLATVQAAVDFTRVIRVMPNLPMILGQGFSVWCASRRVTREQKIFIRALLSAGGQETEIHNDSLFDAITAVSGSGPAYIFSIMDNLTAAAVRLGIKTDVAKKMVAQTIKGSVALLGQSADSPAAWRQRVTSKGGTTAAAFRILDKAHLDKLWFKALTAAAQRSHSLSVLIDKQLRK